MSHKCMQIYDKLLRDDVNMHNGETFMDGDQIAERLKVDGLFKLGEVKHVREQKEPNAKLSEVFRFLTPKSFAGLVKLENYFREYGLSDLHTNLISIASKIIDQSDIVSSPELQAMFKLPDNEKLLERQMLIG